MIFPRLGAIVALPLALGAADGQGLARAQSLGDPMRPPAFISAGGSATGGLAGGTGAGGALVLQSTIMSKGRRIAMIDGKSLSVGDRIGDARIAAIGPSSVTLRVGRETRVLKLYQGVDISSATASKTPASPKARKEGAR